jgi:hypothetical protein
VLKRRISSYERVFQQDRTIDKLLNIIKWKSCHHVALLIFFASLIFSNNRILYEFSKNRYVAHSATACRLDRKLNAFEINCFKSVSDWKKIEQHDHSCRKNEFEKTSSTVTMLFSILQAEED